MEFRVLFPFEVGTVPAVDAIGSSCISRLREVFSSIEMLCDLCRIDQAVVTVEVISCETEKDVAPPGDGPNRGLADCERQNAITHAWRSAVIRSQLIEIDFEHSAN
jgi:hypothetical protein